ncbi:hypothetical protein BDW74DRAFT_176696 [Aspergillus multicolor]|uniref:uncharacterized protein n=1 Tax=Aspergillus multicolor TaxID=41759 RepID=UPI003CCD39E4
MHATYYHLILFLAGAIRPTCASPGLEKAGAWGKADALTHSQEPTSTVIKTVTQCDIIAYPSPDADAVLETSYVTEYTVITVTATAVITAEVRETTHPFTPGQGKLETASASPAGSTDSLAPHAKSGSLGEPTNGSDETTTPVPGYPSGSPTDHPSGSQPEKSAGALNKVMVKSNVIGDLARDLIGRPAYFTCVYDKVGWTYDMAINMACSQLHHALANRKSIVD